MREKSASPADLLVERLRKEDTEFRRLFNDHQSLEVRLEEINRLRHWNEKEELERKKIQKLKLQRKDQMARILREQKTRAAAAH